MILLAFVDVFSQWRSAAFIAVPFLIAYFALLWDRIILNGRILLIACGVIAVLAAFSPNAAAVLNSGASRMIYLPAFVATLGLLRAAASASAVIASAGRHLVNQPPSHRYVALSFGGHFFGILLNIGGLALLVEMVRNANTLEAAGGDASIVAWRERRMTVALLRGFACIAFWSPLGVSFNLLLVSVPGVTWAGAAPIGIACTIAFIGLGWVFDRLQSPRVSRPRPRSKEPGGARSVVTVIAHVAAVSLMTWAVEALSHLSFQSALLAAIPAYGLGWAYAISVNRGSRKPVAGSVSLIIDRGFAQFPSYANEVAVFAASGFLGAALIALVPREALQGFFLAFALPPGLMAGFLTLAVAIMGFVGLNPMIGATILASAVASAELPGLPKTAIVLAIAAGWACTVVLSPVNSALVMTAGLVRHSPWEVSVKWNGAFALAALLSSSATVAVAVSFVS